MRNLKLTIAYDGTNYHGFQTQKAPPVPTVQETLERVLGKLTKEQIIVHSSGRTDAGVHARGQVVNFRTNWVIPVDRIPLAVNSGGLPYDIVVTGAEEVDLSFHARLSAKEKMYRYYLYNHRIPSPFAQRYSYFVPYRLDLDAMAKAAEYYLGTHDFSSFRAVGSPIKSSVRTIYQSQLEKEDNMVVFTVRGNGFLYNMVRIMVGTLILAGRAKIKPEQIADIIDARDRQLAGVTVPPQGLFLEQVIY